MSYVFPSDQDRADDDQLNEACERIEELMDQLVSRQGVEGEPVAVVDRVGIMQRLSPYTNLPEGTKLYTHPASRQALEGKPFTWVFTDVNGEAKEIAGDPVHRSPQDLRIYTALYTHPASADKQAVSVPDGRSNEWLKTLDRWIDLMDRLEGEPINTSVQREIYRVKTEVMRYRKHKVAPKQEQDQ
jgi:hypothetical protein